MTNIRKFVYATLLALSTLSFTPALASAQEPARGQFRLPHVCALAERRSSCRRLPLLV